MRAQFVFFLSPVLRPLPPVYFDCLFWVVFLEQSLNRLQVAYLKIPERRKKAEKVSVRTCAYRLYLKGAGRFDLDG
jgi:hypothetical protein